MSELKLVALDEEDLAIVSAHLQDAVLKVADIAYLPRENRFAALLNRFNWTGVFAERDGNEPMTRHRAAIRVERVTAAQVQALDLTDKGRVLSLLAIQYERTAEDDPAGHITLYFSGGGAIRLAVECVELELRDMGGVWAASSQPQHPDDNSSD